MTAEAYPLEWPEGWPRTLYAEQRRARFATSLAQARDALFDEVRLMGGRSIVLSTNLTLRKDGLPRAQQPEPNDPGAAVYWRTRSGEARCMACDRWNRVRDNIQALRLSINALRGLERWGGSHIVDRAFSGFDRLEAPRDDQIRGILWRSVLEVGPDATLEDARLSARRLRSKHHPDRGGDPDTFRRITQAWHAAQVELTPTGAA